MTTNMVPDGYEDLTRDGALVKTILVEGDGETAGRGAHVAVKYSLRLTSDRNAEPFDTSRNRPDGLLEFTLGRKKVIPALEVAVQSMKIGEKCRVISQPPYAFGSRGLKRKGVPPNATIYLEVELIRFEGGIKKKPFTDMTPAERFEEAKDLKESGNSSFKELKYERAVTQYSQSIRYLTGIFYKSNTQQESTTGNSKAANGDTEHTDSQPVDGEEQTTNSEENEADESGFQEAIVVENEEETEKVEQDSASEEVAEVVDISSGSANAEDQQEPSANAETTSDDMKTVAVGTDNTADDSTENVKPENTEASEISRSTEESSDITSNDPDESEVNSLHVTTLNNLSLCLLKMEEYKRAVETASLALQMNSESHKAFYYRGRARVALGEWDSARSDLLAAAKLAQNNVGIRMEIQKLDRKVKQFEEKEKKQAAAMFA